MASTLRFPLARAGQGLAASASKLKNILWTLGAYKEFFDIKLTFRHNFLIASNRSKRARTVRLMACVDAISERLHRGHRDPVRSGIRTRRPGAPDAPYNIAPTAPVPVVGHGRGGAGHHPAPVGAGAVLVQGSVRGRAHGQRPGRDGGGQASFRAPFKRGRCIIPADGFYEWQARAGGPKQPFCIRAADGSILGFAGLRDRWEGPDGALDTCTIITTTANALMAPIHDRMPVILAPGGPGRLAGSGGVSGAAQGAAAALPGRVPAAYPVGPRVGDARNEGPELMEPPDA